MTYSLEIVGILRRALADAITGKVTAIALVTVESDGSTGRQFADMHGRTIAELAAGSLMLSHQLRVASAIGPQL